MSAVQPIEAFISSSFDSVWTLELMLHLKRAPHREMSSEDLVAALRASSLVVSRGLAALVRAGLVSINERGLARFQPAASDLHEFADQVEKLYASSPDSVRRLIVLRTHDRLEAFAAAFRLWRN